MKDMISFVIIVALIIIAFSLIFLVFNKEAGYGDYLYEAYSVLYGPIDIEEEDSPWPFSQKLLMAVLAFFLNVVLLNLLISIMGDSYGKVLEMRERTDALTRLEMIAEAAIYKKILKPKHQTKRGYLVYCLPVEVDKEEGRQEHEEIQALRQAIKKLQNNVEEKFKSVEESNQKLQKDNEVLKNEIFSLKTYLQNEFSKIK